MNNIKTFLLCFLSVSVSSGALSQTLSLRNDNIAEVMHQLTLEEKLDLIKGSNEKESNSPVIGRTEDLVPGAAGTTNGISRLGIPSIVMADGPAGVRIDPKHSFETKTYYCVHFPIGTALASTWNTDLVKHVGGAIGEEARDYGVDVLLAPAMNIQRNVLNGRNFEYYSEDPRLSADIASAYISGVQSKGVGTSLKHFVANNQESNRSMLDARVSQRALREIYLRGFEWAIKKAQPWTVMSSYNKVNGVYTSQNQDLLETILRKEWGYLGMVVSDWFGGKDAAAQMLAGNNMLQPGYDKEKLQIREALQSGKLKMKDLNKNVEKVLQLITRTLRFKKYKYNNSPDLQAHADITRQSASEAMVLLENRGALPLKANKVAVFGCTSYDIIPGGTGSGNVNRAYTVSLIEGLRNNGYEVNRDVLNLYKDYLENQNEQKNKNVLDRQVLPTELLPNQDILNDAATTSDAAIITLGRTSGEGYDRDIKDFDLSQQERIMLKNVVDAFHSKGKKVVVLLNIGAPVEIKSWASLPDAVLCTWQLGQEGGNSMADMISGKTTPSGKLPMSWPVAVMDDPSSRNMPLDSPSFEFDKGDKVQTHFDRKNIDYTNYDEDIYVGYRYYDTFKKNVAYPFGYGLSYTTFNYSQPGISFDGQQFNLTVNVKNIGHKAGKEVVEVFVTAPRGKLEKPVHELKAFGKTRELQPGESQQLQMTISLRDLASFDTAKSRWIAEKGKYTFAFAASSRDVRTKTDYNLNKNYIEKVHDVLKPQVELHLLTQK
jgi:beta-glucosidase